MKKQAPFEAPVPMFSGPSVTRPDASDEPVLNVKNIQGNIAGFNKDHQRLHFFKITDAAAFRKGLEELVPSVSTVDEVLRFNRLFKETRVRRSRECPTVHSTWVNIAFSFDGLQKLGAPRVSEFDSEAFQEGLKLRGGSSRAITILGDPPAKEDKNGHPSNWVVGGTDANDADCMVIVAADDFNHLRSESSYVRRVLRGAALIHTDEGKTLDGALKGHEHFGFRDGVSQPALRGRVSNDPNDVYTPRQNPDDPNQAKPGQDLLWPGEFVFGYPGQDKDNKNNPAAAPTSAGPFWTKDGSFVVFRRLRQRVGAFHKFVNEQATARGVDPNLLGAKFVGRWTSGAPIERAAQQDNVALAKDDCANNHFEFEEEANSILSGDQDQCLDKTFPPADADPDGAVCPFAGHIRKAYPRDDHSKAIPGQPTDENDTQTHRLLRRGIPFGKHLAGSSLSTPMPEDEADRGLLFLAYQTSLERQFEFVVNKWVNNANFKGPNAGQDPILGQSSGPGRERRVQITLNGQVATIDIPNDFVVATGGGYFFAPSIDALNLIAKGYKS